MRFLGGKNRWAAAIVAEMRHELNLRSRFVDAMCGGLNVTVEAEGMQRAANDACAPLITLYREWLNGWRPTEIIDEALYAKHRAAPDPDSPLTAFLAFGCSYSGAWFNGWARPTQPRPKVPNGEVFAESAIRSLNRKLARCRGVVFSSLDFRALDVDARDVVYFDPEYKGTKRYAYYTEPFDYPAFVLHCSTLAHAGVSVFVSEYASQHEAWEQIATFTSGKRSSTQGAGIERLFRVRA